MTRPKRTIPARRTERVLVREFGAEVVVYDLDADRVTHLDADTAAVWRACDRPSTLADVAAFTGLPESAAAAALLRLDDAGLLGDCLLSAGPGLSRRQLLQRLGIVAAVTPLISVSAASAAAAASVPTVSASQTACTSSGANRKTITLRIDVAGFTPSPPNVTVDVTYKPPTGPDQTDQVPVTVASNGSGSSTVTIDVKRSGISLAALQVLTSGNKVATGTYTALLC